MDINLIGIILEFLPINTLLQISNINMDFYVLCNNFTMNKYNLSIYEVSKKFCQDKDCNDKNINESTIKTNYCEEHLYYHKCADCHRIQTNLQVVIACPERNCCDKLVCINRCNRLQCQECKYYYTVGNTYRKIDKENIICKNCYSVLEGDKEFYRKSIKWNDKQ
jgi:hypothetical protein